MNYRIFELINNLALKNSFLDNIMIFSSKYLPYIIVLIICAVFVFGILHRKFALRKAAVLTAMLIAANLTINFLIGCFIYVPRPFASHKVNLLFAHVSDSSFPSDHATVTMSTAVGLINANRILGWICVLLSLLVGFSRVYVGHHYPLDIIGSYFIVILTNLIFHRFIEKKTASLYFKTENRIIHCFSKAVRLPKI